jgi:hypothetical protein
MPQPFTPRPPRRRVDLHRLPPAARWTLAVAVIALVAGLAWWSGRDDPVPFWITRWLVPALGYAWLVLAAVALVSHWRRRRPKPPARDDAGRRP